ncbi:MAG: SGNH/GDSL hydrolase family protein [Muribaculaceae bacterium]|nr:SGNH/GDSL hydrolase family protein [Muribaculaceae bacterium]
MAIIPASGIAKVRSIALLGDSLTWLGGDSCTNPSGWSHYLRESGLADNIEVFARSGATWTNTPESRPDTEAYSEILHPDNVIFNQILRLGKRIEDPGHEAPEIIIIMAGTNDAWFSDRFPMIFAENETTDTICVSDPAKVTTLSGSVALGCRMLKEMAPECSILIVTPPENAKVSAEAIHHVSDIIEGAALRNGVKVARADRECGITHDSEATSPLFTYDGVHTNPEGARIVADYILSQLTNDN